LFSISFSQSFLYIVRGSGSIDSVDIDAISKITFSTSEMIISGASKTISLSDINLLLFADSSIPVPNNIEDEADKPVLDKTEISPNPFNPLVHVKFNLLAAGHTDVTVMSSRGEIVAELINKKLSAGYYDFMWDGNTETGARAASGTYIFRISINQKNICKRAIMIR